VNEKGVLKMTAVRHGAMCRREALAEANSFADAAAAWRKLWQLPRSLNETICRPHRREATIASAIWEHLTAPTRHGPIRPADPSLDQLLPEPSMSYAIRLFALALLLTVSPFAHSADEPKSAAANGAAPAASDAATPDTATIAALKKYLATPAAERKDLAGEAFAEAALTKAEAKTAAELLWADYAARAKTDRAKEVKDRMIELAGKKMPFWYKTFGEKPATGRSLFISMHGGGGAPKAVNDSQWENQKRLYSPKEGVYLCPRAPTDTWNLWHEGHIDPMFARIIQDMVIFEDVNPDRVYLMGYSAGGDGVYQLAPRMSDRWAAVSMMAGHPNETSPLGLRNVPFALHVGGLDAAYNRNKIGREWKTKLDELQKADPEGYEHEVQIHENKGHWMDREDAVAVEWMAKHTRNTSPKKIVWRQDDVKHPRFYWLEVDPSKVKAGATIVATRDGQKIAIETKDAKEVKVLLNDDIVDLDQPLAVSANAKEAFRGKATRKIATLAHTLADYGDPKLMFSAEATAKVE
jgi:hypothetical protein